MRYKKLKTLVIGISLIMQLSACGNGSAEVMATSSEIEVETQDDKSNKISGRKREEGTKEGAKEKI